MKSFGAYVTDELIIRFLARERGKYAVKNQAKQKKHPDYQCRAPLYLELCELLPPRDQWSNPGMRRRPVHSSGNDVRAWTYGKRMGAERVFVSTVKLRREHPNAPWAQRLEAFLADIHATVEGRAEIGLGTPAVLPLFKKEDPETGDRIYRPICLYRDLRTKVLLSLTNSYALYAFDRCFHYNMLYARSARRDRSTGQWCCPQHTDAIRMASEYRAKRGKEMIFVGECDIQKFYDILHHDVIISCFRELFAQQCRRFGLEEDFFAPLERMVRAYLDSYDYYHHVMALNDPASSVWKVEKRRCMRGGRPEPVCRFQWVSDEAFLSCYTPEALAEAKEKGLLGIPQGGALSGIIVNVVMQSVDREIVGRRDPERFFVRYCDDILLMHTDKAACQRYLDTYVHSLVGHKLVPHPLKGVSGFKQGSRTHREFWDAKSKEVFKWGTGGGDASDWVAFVGYEMRRTGEIRLRKDKVDRECKRIARVYYKAFFSKKEDKERLLEGFSEVNELFFRDGVRTMDRYAISQARHLDKYLVRKFYRMARRFKISVDARESLTRYIDRIGLG